VVINVQALLGLADDVNVHIWYDPGDDAEGRRGRGRRAGEARPAERRVVREP
jgi:hypothetical protein